MSREEGVKSRNLAWERYEYYLKKPNHISKSQLRLVIVTVAADLKVGGLLKGRGGGELGACLDLAVPLSA